MKSEPMTEGEKLIWAAAYVASSGRSFEQRVDDAGFVVNNFRQEMRGFDPFDIYDRMAVTMAGTEAVAGHADSGDFFEPRVCETCGRTLRVPVGSDQTECSRCLDY